MATSNHSLNSTSTTGNYIYASPNTYTINGGSLSSNLSTIYTDTFSFDDPGLKSFAQYIVFTKSETELMEILTEIKIAMDSISDTSSSYKDMVKSIIRTRHFSEEFLLNYIDLFDPDEFRTIVLVQHKADILSKKYATLALKIMLDD